MALRNTVELDAAFRTSPFAKIVPRLPLQPGGVDPLGLRQINLNLMDLALPGINNVTTIIRPYVMMTWAWWKAGQLVQQKSTKDFPADKFLNIVDRLETVFIWSHILAKKSEGLPGRLVLGRALPGKGDSKSYSFSDKEWEALRKDRRANTSVMSAVQYGPSIRISEGIGWLAPIKGAFRPVDDVMDAVNAFDQSVSQDLPAALTNLDGGALTSKRALQLYPKWSSSKPTPTERRVFRALFFEHGKAAKHKTREFRRYATLELIRGVLGSAGKPLDADSIRRMMFTCRLAGNKKIHIEAELVPAHKCWLALQARQLQRIGLEALLVWVENEIDQADGCADAPSLYRAAHESSRLDELVNKNGSVGTYYAAVAALAKPYGWPDAGGLQGEADIFSLIQEIIEAQTDEDFDRLPSLALKAIFCSALICETLQKPSTVNLNDLIGGPPDRLPLARILAVLKGMANEKLSALWREIIESWVLGQHVRWAVARSGDQTQRLRLAIDEGGWVRLRSKRSGPFRPTPDRLNTALSLSADCGLLKRTAGDPPLFSVT